MSDTLKIKVFVSTNKVGSECEDEFEIDRAEWEALNEDERERMARDAAFNWIDWHYVVQE